jgi:hypothetical protein
MKASLTFIFTVFVTVSSYAQLTTIWEENFIGYTDQTGVEVNGGTIANTGDYDTSVSKWTLDTSNVNLSNADAKGQVLNATNGTPNPRFVAQNTGGDLIWESEVIDVSSFSTSILSVIVSRIDNLTDSDYIDVYWKVGDFPFILLDDDNSGHTLEGNSSDECWETEKVMFDLTVTTQTTAQIRVVMNTNSSNGSVALDKVSVFGE